MLKRIISLAFSLVFGVVASGLVNTAQVQAMSDQKIEIVKSNCQSSQVTLKQIQLSDVATRISRGRDYQQLIKLMATFNSRLALNKIDAGNLTTITADMEGQFNNFQQTYINYSDQLGNLISINCQNKPSDFYNQLEAARGLRSDLAKQVDEMDQLLDGYQKGVNDIAKQLAQETAS
ncbi:MAG TPA: hypothetical protein VFL81_01530 [Candidatus Saccharimonadales bacterium]|nr:hypothetical protein [Candidatus Saccharimonadales bacterium]